MIKFYHWFENNKYALFRIKLQILYTCVLPTILYGAETWWIIDQIKEVILDIERNALKKCLGIKVILT